MDCDVFYVNDAHDGEPHGVRSCDDHGKSHVSLYQTWIIYQNRMDCDVFYINDAHDGEPQG